MYVSTIIFIEADGVPQIIGTYTEADFAEQEWRRYARTYRMHHCCVPSRGPKFYGNERGKLYLCEGALHT